jgi:hypothetical protein
MFSFLRSRRQNREDQLFALAINFALEQLLGHRHPKFVADNLALYINSIAENVRPWRIAGRNPKAVAAELLAIMLGKRIEELSDESKKRFLVELRQTADQLPATNSLAAVARFYLEQIAELEHQGEIDHDTFLLYVDEIVGAGEGIGSEERSNRRVLDKLVDASLEAGWLCGNHGEQNLVLIDRSGSGGDAYALVCATCANKYLREVSSKELKAFRDLFPNVVFSFERS